MRINGNSVVLLGLVLAGLLVSSCAQSRPAASAWEQDWHRILDIVPDEPSVGENLPEAVCEDALSSLRSEKVTVFPTSDEMIDGIAAVWFEVAEGAFFECPPEDGGFAAAYDEMEGLQVEIEAVLKINGK